MSEAALSALKYMKHKRVAKTHLGKMDFTLSLEDAANSTIRTFCATSLKVSLTFYPAFLLFPSVCTQRRVRDIPATKGCSKTKLSTRWQRQTMICSVFPKGKGALSNRACFLKVDGVLQILAVENKRHFFYFRSQQS